ncbi:MAG: methylenetetrahydrofolate reductase [Verrucomicrobiia bacterium]
MRFIRDIYASAKANGRPVVSFELFTPKTPEGEHTLAQKTLPTLAALKPAYCSVTYGAGGSTRHKTIDLVQSIQVNFGVPGMAHLTCIGANRDQILALLLDARQRGICNLLALRGDPPAGTTAFAPEPGGFRFAYELVELACKVGGFSVGVAGFPEGHIECREGKHVDWLRLKEKIDRGADFVITQLFFDNSFFYEFRDHLIRHLHVNVPIVPGIITILNASQIRKFTALSGASIPQTVIDKLHQLGDNDEAVADFGVEFATQQCADLLRNGVPGIHFYTLNKARSVSRILANLGMADSESAAHARNAVSCSASEAALSSASKTGIPTDREQHVPHRHQ